MRISPEEAYDKCDRQKEIPALPEDAAAGRFRRIDFPAMRTPDLDRILSAMLKTYDGISDLNFSVGHPLQVEDFGELKPVFVDPPIERLTPYQTEQIRPRPDAGEPPPDARLPGRAARAIAATRSADEARFRVNIFRQQGQFCDRHAETAGRSSRRSQSLGLPPIFERNREGERPASCSSPARPAAARPRRWPRS